MKDRILKLLAFLILTGGACGALAGFYFIVTECIPYVMKCID